MSSCLQPSSDKEQFAERKQGEQLRLVLCEAPVAGVHVSELALDQPERMLNPGPRLDDDPVDLLVDEFELTALWHLAHHTSDLAILTERGLAFGTKIALVCPDLFLLAMEQFIPVSVIMNLRGRGLEAVDGRAPRFLTIFVAAQPVGDLALQDGHCVAPFMPGFSSLVA